MAYQLTPFLLLLCLVCVFGRYAEALACTELGKVPGFSSEKAAARDLLARTGLMAYMPKRRLLTHHL